MTLFFTNGIIFPGLGLGYRAHGKFGFDLDFTAYTYWDGGYCLYGKAHGLYFPTGEHFYIGAGPGCIGGRFAHIFTEGSGSFIKPTMEWVIGYEWNVDERPPLFPDRNRHQLRKSLCLSCTLIQLGLLKARVKWVYFSSIISEIFTFRWLLAKYLR